MRHRFSASASRAGLAALLTLPAVAGLVFLGAQGPTPARAAGPSGDYQRAILVSWDGVRRDVLFDLLQVSDPTVPCWASGDVFPVATGAVGPQGAPLYTCLPGLGGARPADAPMDAPAYAPFQVLASHATNDGNTMTKPQHASMLTGLNAETHGLTTNETKGGLEPDVTIYEILMNAFDPISPLGERNGRIFRTVHLSDRKYIGNSVCRWAKRSDALQVASSNGNDAGDRLGPVLKAQRSFDEWKQDELELGLSETDFFVFLHFKSPDWAGHRSGPASPAYYRSIVQTDRKLYALLDMLRRYGWEDTAVLVTTDHGFHRDHHGRHSGRNSFNTWLAAYNVNLSVDHIPMRTPQDYCASHVDPADCLANGPEEPMPPEDVVRNILVTSVTPTLLDMFGVEWRSTTGIEGVSLYNP